MRRGNDTCSLPRRRRAVNPMAEYDRLPADLRRWLNGAALPWSPRSALRAWQGALRDAGGDAASAARALSGIEERLLQRDAAKVWGASHPKTARGAVTAQ